MLLFHDVIYKLNLASCEYQLKKKLYKAAADTLASVTILKNLTKY